MLILQKCYKNIQMIKIGMGEFNHSEKLNDYEVMIKKMIDHKY